MSLKYLLRWSKRALKGGIMGSNMENQLLIAQKINDLNRESWRGNGMLSATDMPQVWNPISDYLALTVFEFNHAGGPPVFNANKGYPLKAFVNKNTGEVRIYAATLFETTP